MPELFGPLQSVELSSTLWLIPLLALLGAAINAAIGWRLQRSSYGNHLSHRLHIGSWPVSVIAMGSVGLGFLLSLAHVAQLAGLPHDRRFLYCHLWQMVRVGTFDLSFDLSLDTLSGVMLLVVTGVGFLIHVYAGAYMHADKSYWRFFSYLNLFIFSMLLLILGDNFLVMFFGWEGVGLCSYLLIGFWYKDYKKASAGTKAFLTNRVGDFGFLVGFMILLWGLGGAWSHNGEYVTDRIPRLMAVLVQAEPGHAGEADREAEEHREHKAPHNIHEIKPPSQAFVSFTAFPGAKVYLDNDLSKVFAEAPFVRKEITAQRHTLRIAMGGATEDLIIEHAPFLTDKETLLAPIGPILSFHAIQDQFLMRSTDKPPPGIEPDFPVRDRIVGRWNPDKGDWSHPPRTLWGIGLITLACIGFFIGATGKSAQIPLYVWLPDAMAGPTPVSALIHAATMVTAGVYMVARLNFLFCLSPTASAIVASVGAVTALFAASIGFFQYDIKKVLAYSTVSQLGFMFIGVGVGAYWAGIFHLMTHAFFKACLFLGSGSVIHGMHAVEHDADRAQDMRNMGGLGKVMPLTRRTYYVACLAITAAPIPLLSGFWSKDEILWKAFTTLNTGWMPGWAIWLMGLIAAVGTSFYMWRSYYLTFEGKPANPAIPEKVKESPPAMTWVLVTLAGLAAVAGVIFGASTHLIGQHGEPLLEAWLHPVLGHARVSFQEHGLSMEYALMVVSVLLAIAAWSQAKKSYGPDRPADWEARERKFKLFTLIHNKYYVDEIYDASVIRGVLAIRLVLRDADRWVIDGLVNSTGVFTKAAAWANGAIDRYVVDGAVNWVADIVLGAGARIRQIQTGRIQSYVYGLLAGVGVLTLLWFLVEYYSGAR